MRVVEILVFVIFFGLILYLGSNPLDTEVNLFDKGVVKNQSFFERASPRYSSDGFEKPLYERVIEFVFVAPTMIFPNAPWVGPVLIFGGLYILYLKWDVTLAKIKRKILFKK